MRASTYVFGSWRNTSNITHKPIVYRILLDDSSLSRVYETRLSPPHRGSDLQRPLLHLLPEIRPGIIHINSSLRSTPCFFLALFSLAITLPYSQQPPGRPGSCGARPLGL